MLIVFAVINISAVITRCRDGDAGQRARVSIKNKYPSDISTFQASYTSNVTKSKRLPVDDMPVPSYANNEVITFIKTYIKASSKQHIIPHKRTHFVSFRAIESLFNLPSIHLLSVAILIFKLIKKKEAAYVFLVKAITKDITLQRIG